VSHATRSLWLEEALAGASYEPPLRGEERADVCIIGGGFTGLWAALALKERDAALDVALVERDVCGGGASGRNGGFVLSWWAKFEALAGLCGSAQALRLARATADAVTEIGDWCREHGVDAHFRRDGWLWTATNAAQIGSWDSTIAALERAGERPFERLDASEVARRAGSDVHMAGVYEAGAATVQPALLARGLRSVALSRGVRIFEHSPMTSLERRRPPVVRTPGGSVIAERMVIAMNAWATRLREVRRSVVVVSSDVVATAPMPERLAAIGRTDGLCIDDSRLLVNYYRTTLDGRLVFGQGGGTLAFDGRVSDRFDGRSPREDEVRAGLRYCYPDLADVAITHTWTGPIDRTSIGLPFFWHLGGHDEIVVGVGYSGNGVGPSRLGGRILASLALGVDDEWARCGLARRPAGGWLPPEPARYLGGKLVRAAVARKERAEDAGRRPNRATLALARMAPAGLVPINERPDARMARR
jgi:putative aminophosphonate oxidoreductase